MEEKYRKVKKNNAAFQRRLGGLSGGDAAMKAAGFVVENDATDSGEEVYMMHASAEGSYIQPLRFACLLISSILTSSSFLNSKLYF